MSEDYPARDEQSPTGLPDGPAPEDDRTAPGGTGRTYWSTLRWLMLRAAAFVGAFVLMLVLLTACAGMYTSRPEFCRSCHIMEPYCESWEESSHSHVSCIKCHFPPGFGEKVRGKMLGLVQLAKYVTRTEGPRPAAEIPDASCLRSGCHETRLLSGKVDFHGIPFDHKPHLENLRRGKELRCTSCHGQMVQGDHMSVTTSTCFLCHFKDGLFNEGVGMCTRCHQIPEEEYQLGGGITFSHALASERGVDCANCHRDLIRGNGEVPHERCRVCHNRADDLAQIDDHVFMHKNHVSDHKIDCTDCHLEIEHSLDREKMLHASSDCQACHPDHHSEQIRMFQGVGAKTVPGHADSMLATRLDCRSCHRMRKISDTGTVLWTASAETCLMCHDEATVNDLEAYHTGLKGCLPEVESGILRIRKALKLAELSDERTSAIAAQLDAFQADLDFLRVGNGVHNVHFASTLTRALVDRVSSLCRELKIDQPEATLPETLVPLE